MKTFIEYITEAQDADSWENLIAAAWNMYCWKASEDKRKEASLAELTKSSRAPALWANEKFHNQAKSIAMAASRYLPTSEKMIQFGAGSGSLSQFWKSNGGSNSTPKTDCYLEGEKYRLSFKKGGSQLASPQGGEATATFTAALNIMEANFPDKLSSALKKEISSTIDEFEEGFKFRDFNVDTGDIKEIARELAIAASAELQDKQALRKATILNLKKPMDALLGNNAPEQLISYLQGQVASAKLTTGINKILANSKEFKYSVIFETASGYKKFANGDKSKANYMFKFDNSFESLDNIYTSNGIMTEKTIKKLENGINSIIISFKAHGRTQAATQAFQSVIKKEFGVKTGNKINIPEKLNGYQQAISTLVSGIPGAPKDSIESMGLRKIASGIYVMLYRKHLKALVEKLGNGKNPIDRKYEDNADNLAFGELERILNGDLTLDKSLGDIPVVGKLKTNVRINYTAGTKPSQLANRLINAIDGMDPEIKKAFIATQSKWLPAAMLGAVKKLKVGPALRIRSLVEDIQSNIDNVIVETVNTEYSNLLLNESIFTSIADMAKNMYQWMINTITKVFRVIKNILMSIVDKGIIALLDYLNVSGSVRW